MLTHHSEEPLMRLLADQTRRGEVHGPALARAHREIRSAAGRRRCALHRAGAWRSASDGRGHRGAHSAGQCSDSWSPMRAGLFLAEGVWEGLGGGSLVPYHAGVGDLSGCSGGGAVGGGHRQRDQLGPSICGGAIQVLLDRRCRRLVVVTLVGYRSTLRGDERGVS